MGLAFPIGALANAANASLTLQGHWEKLRRQARVSPRASLGLYLGVAVAILASFAAFPSVGSVTALTGLLGGDRIRGFATASGVLLAAGVVFEALPRMSGREPATLDRPRSFNRWTVIGVGGVGVSMIAAGLVSGYSWVAGSNSAAYVNAGEGWAAGAGAAEVLMLVAFGFGIVAFLGQLAYAATVIGTVTMAGRSPRRSWSTAPSSG